MEFITCKHSMPGGDLISLMPGLRQLYRSTGKKIIIYQRVNLSYSDFCGSYTGATYSIKDDKGIAVTMNRSVFEALKPLLLSQEYIEDLREFDGQKIDYDFDELRQRDTTMWQGAISRWPFYIFPEMACNLSEQVFHVEGDNIQSLRDTILINRTERYNNMLISYNFLKRYKVAFVGLGHECDLFRQQFNFDIPQYYFHNDLKQLAIAMQSCKLFIGNQSMCFQIAEMLKIPRLLEVCKQIPNVIGSGPGFYDFLNQYSLEYYVDNILNNNLNLEYGNNGEGLSSTHR